MGAGVSLYARRWNLNYALNGHRNEFSNLVRSAKTFAYKFIFPRRDRFCYPLPD